MAVKVSHSSEYALHFCTFTCYQWLNLFEITQSYERVYSWFEYLKESKNVHVVSYVVMPNHLHVILYLPSNSVNLNKIIANGKRFLAYAIVERLKVLNRIDMLDILASGITLREHEKGQKHRVFEESFDAKAIFSQHFLDQKMEYIHFNPVRGKWKLAADYTQYPHSSAGFYETGTALHFQPTHYNDLWTKLDAGS